MGNPRIENVIKYLSFSRKFWIVCFISLAQCLFLLLKSINMKRQQPYFWKCRWICEKGCMKHKLYMAKCLEMFNVHFPSWILNIWPKYSTGCLGVCTLYALAQFFLHDKVLWLSVSLCCIYLIFLFLTCSLDLGWKNKCERNFKSDILLSQTSVTKESAKKCNIEKEIK